ncbi:LamG-like jellyroll fold domain-containing protein, partial [Campylobacterota bacterium]
MIISMTRMMLYVLLLNSSLFALCSIEHNQSFTVNEFNTKNNWFELYANPSNIQSPVTGWSVDIRANGKSQSKTFNFDIDNGSFFIIIEDLTVFNQIDLKNHPLDVVIRDASGAVVNYFNLGLGTALSTPLEVQECGLDIPCNYFMRSNSGERAFMRVPDGGCTLTDTNWRDDTKGESNTGAVPIAAPVADYHFDECVWNGSPLEVIDSSGNNYHGTSIVSNTSVDGQIYRSGDFTADGIEDYLTLDHRALDGLDSFSMSVWIKTPYDKTMIPISGARAGTGSNEAIMWFTGGSKFKPYINQTQADTINLTTNVADGNWHHFVWTRKGIKNCAYVDGTAPVCIDVPGSSGALTIAPGGLIVGQEQDGVGTGFNANQDYEGLLDEFKIFNSSLSLAQVQKVYNNESIGKNYDGTVRAPVTCVIGTPKDGNYTAVDYTAVCNAQTNWNDNIKTKIVNDTFDFSILAKDIATDAPLEANITKVTLKYYPDGDNSVCTGISSSQIDLCTDCGATDADGCLSLSVPAVVNNKASKCVEVVIEGKDKTDATGTSLSTSISRDNFSIRPNTYDCSSIAPSTLIAERPYTSDFIATPLNLSSSTAGYTTTSVALRADVYMRTGELNTSLAGTMTPSSLSFTDGNASNVNVSFNNVGDIGIDINDSNWANVDSDDTLESERTIHAECRRIFRPDHFLVQVTRPLLENNSTDFTYLSNLTPSVTMSAWARDLNVTITAQG